MELQKTKMEISTQTVNGTELATSVYKINLAMGYPLSERQTEEWAVCVSKLLPEATKKDVDDSILRIISGEESFDQSKGIRDLLSVIKRTMYSNRVIRNGFQNQQCYYMECLSKKVRPVRWENGDELSDSEIEEQHKIHKVGQYQYA